MPYRAIPATALGSGREASNWRISAQFMAIPQIDCISLAARKALAGRQFVLKRREILFRAKDFGSNTPDVNPKKFLNAQPDLRLKSLAERRDRTAGLVSHGALHSMHGEEHGVQSDG